MAKYLLIENRQIVHLGPVDWRPRFIQSEIEDLGIYFTVPPTEQGYIRLSDNVELIPVVDFESPVIDPNFEMPVGPTWNFNDVLLEGPEKKVRSSSAIAVYDKKDKPLEEVRQTIINLTASIRYNKEQLGTKVVIRPEVLDENNNIVSPAIEVTADTSRDGRAIFVQVYSTMADGATVDWKFPEGWFNITKEELGLVIAGGFTYIQEQFVWEKSIIDRVYMAADMAELKAIYDEINPVLEPTIPGV